MRACASALFPDIPLSLLFLSFHKPPLEIKPARAKNAHFSDFFVHSGSFRAGTQLYRDGDFGNRGTFDRICSITGCNHPKHGLIQIYV
jgi:hypothetical protein